MADLLGGGPAVSNGNGASSTRPTAPPTQTASPSSGIRGPRRIMQERQEREARQRAEREQLERSRAEQEARLLEEQNRQSLERERRAAAGAAQGAGSTTPARRGEASTQRRNPQQQPESQGRPPAGSSQNPPAAPNPQPRPPRAPATSQAPPSTSLPAAASGTAPPGPGAQTGETSAAGGGTRPRNTFPHAFERWEALSAHWEGLTSFWIRQLEQRSAEIDRDPLSQQIARQVTDLSAAGANLFHAVVELQRLRASSERKFQRWFFETRADIERHTEVNAMLEAALDEERRGRANAIRDAVEHERSNSRTQRQLLEMRKELGISKEEARRAWEELGRREQEERDRTISLQQGHPTIVGGVQVVPMTQGVPSRHGSTRTAQSEPAQAEYTRPSAGRPVVSPGTGPDTPGGFYHQPASTAHQGDVSYGGGGSEGGYSEGEYAIDGHGNFIRDSHGNKIPFRSVASPEDESDHGAEEYGTPASHSGISYPPSASHQYQPAGPGGAAPADYAGQGYAAPGWETVPRHHHPTRLSDVIEEEDERSRTSASQVSRA